MTDKRILPAAAVLAIALQIMSWRINCSEKGKMNPNMTLPAPCFGPPLVIFFLYSILLQRKELIPVMSKVALRFVRSVWTN